MGQAKMNVVGIWNYGFKDPIWIMTNIEPEAALRLYFKRMKIEISFRDLKNLLLMVKVMNKWQARLEKMLALVMMAYTNSILIGEAIRDVQYANVDPAAIDLLTISETDKHSKWHSFSGPFLLLKRRCRLGVEQLCKIVAAVLKLFANLVFGNVRSFVRT